MRRKLKKKKANKRCAHHCHPIHYIQLIYIFVFQHNAQSIIVYIIWLFQHREAKKKQHRKQFPRFRFMKNKTILKTNTNTPGPIRFKSGACVEEKKKRKTNESIVVDGRNGPEKRQTRHNATVHIWMTWKSGRNWKLTKEMHFKYTINELHEFLNGAEMHK